MKLDMQLDADWEEDCCGKKDYDSPLISLSSRFWPKGGSFFEVNTATNEIKTGEDRPWIKPSAKSSLLLYYKDSKGISDYKILVSKEFEAETEEEVKQQVEAWAAEQYSKLVELALTHYADTVKDPL